MKLKDIICGMVFLCGLYGVFVSAADSKAHQPLTAEADLMNSKGEKIGTAHLTQLADGVSIAIQAENLPPGKHGIHFHETGICTGPDFKTAGEHLGSKQKHHGLKNPKGPHLGDLPNLEVQEDGKVSTEMMSHAVTLRKDKNSLLKKGETALVIHEKADDQATDPSGDSGARIACGVVTTKKVTG